MDLFSVNSNMGATVALESLSSTTSQMDNAESQISTGYRVSDAQNDGAAYAVAQRVRSDVATLTTSNQQLGSADSLVGTTISSLNDVSNTLISIRSTMTELGNSGLDSTSRGQYTAQLKQLVTQVSSFLQDSSYNGKSLIGDIGGQSISGMTMVRNEVGTTYGVSTWSGNTHVMASLSAATSSSLTAGYFQTALGSSGMLSNVANGVGTALNNFGSISNYLNNQVSYNSDKIDSLNTGLGTLVDANLAQESAQLQALQIKQQLATQSLSLANQAPSILLKLFQ
jgi:flagellin